MRAAALCALLVAAQTNSHMVTSPKHSNLHIRFRWTQPAAAVGLSATIVEEARSQERGARNQEPGTRNQEHM